MEQVPVYAESDGVPRSPFDALWIGIDPRRFVCREFSDWNAFTEACAAVLAGVVVAPHVPRSTDLEHRAVQLVREIPAALVWVGSGPEPGARRGGVATGIVRAGSSAPGASTVRVRGAAFHHARTLGFLRGVALCLDSTPRISPLLRRCLHIGLLHDPPIRAVATFAQKTGITPRRLRNRWSAESIGETPKAFLQWVLTVHAAMRKPLALSWEWMAKELGVTVQSLWLAVRRTLDCTLAEAAGSHGLGAMATFGRHLMEAYGVEFGESSPPSKVRGSGR